MKEIIKYISFLICFLPFMSCSVEEVGVEPSDGTVIEFIARPTSFTTCDVATKAAAEQWESEIKTSYMLLYGAEGDLELGPVALGNNPAYKYATDGDYTVCFLANVPSDFMKGDFSTLNDLKGAVLDLAYSDSFSFTDSEGNDITPINVPYLELGNGYEECMPMFGMATSSSISKSGNKAIVTLERLFAKVNLTVSMDLSTASGLINRASFVLKKINLSNIPSKVALVGDMNNNSAWVSEKGSSFVIEPDATIYDFDAENELGIVSDYSCTCYVPEYSLLPTGQNNDQKKKPLYYDPDTCPVFFRVEGNFTHPDLDKGKNVLFTYDLFLGEDALDSFSLERNNEYNFKMTITGINEARLETDERITAEFEVHDLAALEPANCYVISQIGRYMIPLVKGNTYTSIEDASKVDLSKTDYSISSNTANKITNLKLLEIEGVRYIRFDVNMAALNEVEDGNTMLIVKDSSGNVLWSWHLWFDGGGFFDTSIGELANEKYPDEGGNWNNYYVMDRAIGASGQTADDGMYYQWGDKDPYLKGAYQGGVDAGSWEGDEKTITDPCPPGFKVPSSDIWRSSNPDGYLSTQATYQYNASQLGTGMNQIFYPYSSCIDIDGNVLQIPTWEEEYYIEGPIDAINLTNPRMGSVRIHELLVRVETDYKFGLLWSNTYEESSDRYLSLQYAFSGLVLKEFSVSSIQDRVDVISCKVEERTFSWSGPKWSGKENPVAPKDLTDAERSAIFLEIVLGDDIKKTYYVPNCIDYSSSYGLQVRCVKE